MTREEISSLLNFYQESGLDFPIADQPVNQFETTDRKSESSTQKTPETASSSTGVASNISDPHSSPPIEMDPRKRKVEEKRPVAQASNNVTLPTGEVVANAIEAAENAHDLDALKRVVESFEGCNLKRSARSTIFEGGKRGAKIMMIGSCPGRDDDVAGNAFSGPDGILLEKMLSAIGLSRLEDVYHGFCVPWSPPGSSAPTPLHLEICAPFLAKQIQLAAPSMVIVLGNVAARQVYQSKQTIVQLRGRWTTLPNFGIESMAMCSPSMLRAQPDMKRSAWLDLLSIQEKLTSQN